MAHENKKDFYDMYRDENSTFIKNYDERMRKNQKKQLSKVQVFTIRLCFILLFSGIAAALISALYFGGMGKRYDPLVFDIKAKDSVKSGEEISYDIEIENSGTTPLAGLALNVEFPDSFHFAESSPVSTNADHTYWKLDSIQKGGKTRITLIGTLVGNDSDEKKFKAILHYKIGENGTEYIAKREKSTRISEQLFQIDFRGPQLVEPAQEIEYVIEYGDSEKIGISNDAFLRLSVPKQFSYESKTATEQLGMWTSDELKKGIDPSKGKGIIEIKGKFLPEARGDHDLLVQFVTKKNGSEVTLQEKKLNIHLIQNPLSLKARINDSEDVRAISFGSPSRLTLRYENQGTDDLTDVRITLSSASQYLDWSTVSAQSQGVIKDSVIEWTKKELPVLERIKPGQSGELLVDFSTKDAVLASRIIEQNSEFGKPISLSLSVDSSMTLSRATENREVRNQPLPIEIPLNSDARMTLTSTPAQSGARTLQIDIENFLHEIKDIRVEMPLKEGVEWGGGESRSAGEIRYDEKNRMVVWTLNRMPLSVKGIHSTYKLITPSDQDALESALFRAIDVVTKGQLEYRIDSPH